MTGTHAGRLEGKSLIIYKSTCVTGIRICTNVATVLQNLNVVSYGDSRNKIERLNENLPV